jgi:hypothetical protein
MDKSTEVQMTESMITFLENRIQDGEAYLRVRVIPKEKRTNDDQRALLRFKIAMRMNNLNLEREPTPEEYLLQLREQLLTEKLKTHMQGLADGTIPDPFAKEDNE